MLRSLSQQMNGREFLGDWSAPQAALKLIGQISKVAVELESELATQVYMAMRAQERVAELEQCVRNQEAELNAERRTQEVTAAKLDDSEAQVCRLTEALSKCWPSGLRSGGWLKLPEAQRCDLVGAFAPGWTFAQVELAAVALSASGSCSHAAEVQRLKKLCGEARRELASFAGQLSTACYEPDIELESRLLEAEKGDK
jgi:hypothetical protein